MCNYGALLGESFYMLSFATEERFRDEEREVSVLCSGFLEHQVELMLHFLPNSVAVGLDDHASAYGRLLSEVSLGHKIVVPLAVVL